MNPTSMMSFPPAVHRIASGVPPLWHVCRPVDRSGPTDLGRRLRSLASKLPRIESGGYSDGTDDHAARSRERGRRVFALGAELIATVVYMVNGGHVRLCGTFKGSRFDLTSLAA
jgi:hypothetical protein